MIVIREDVLIEPDYPRRSLSPVRGAEWVKANNPYPESTVASMNFEFRFWRSQSTLADYVGVRYRWFTLGALVMYVATAVFGGQW